MSAAQGFIYAVQAETGEIKIGFTSTPTTRLSSLSTACPTKLTKLLLVRGDKSDEAAIHNALGKFRIRGEWFSASPEVVETIAEMRATQGVAYPRDDGRRKKASHNAEVRARLAHEAQALVFAAAEPLKAGETVKMQMARASKNLGLPDWRVREAWYGGAGSWSASAMQELRAACARIEHVKANALEAKDADFYRQEIDRLRALADQLGGEDRPGSRMGI